MDDRKVQQQSSHPKKKIFFCLTCGSLLADERMDQRKVQQESSHAISETFFFFFFVSWFQNIFYFFASWFQNIFFDDLRDFCLIFMTYFWLTKQWMREK